MEKIERIPSGISGLDELIEGGFLKGSMVLVSGKTGTGKTTFGIEFLVEGLKRGEKCIFISLEEAPEEIRMIARHHGWNLEKFEKENLLEIMHIDPLKISEIEKLERNVFSYIIDEIKNREGIKRLVMDPISVLEMYIEYRKEFRKELLKLKRTLSYLGCTSILISEIPEGSESFSRLGIVEFVVDGIIKLDFVPIGSLAGRHLLVRKMRITKHDENLHPIEISKEGIRVLSF
ncbi:MAG: hypothetical protein DRO65_04075 [Candidatus Altiarchaeales archaeon]|nr:MAG: hypothetical protein DRO65_04075 [Candidatus Altiarchaeales archaeon]